MNPILKFLIIFILAAYEQPVKVDPFYKVPEFSLAVVERRASNAAVPASAVVWSKPAMSGVAVLRVAVYAQTTELQAWTYNLDQAGKRAYYELGRVPAGGLVKRGPCAVDGFSQIEYQDNQDGGWWRVRWIECKGGVQ